MIANGRGLILLLSILLTVPALSSCLSIDLTPLGEQPAYLKTQKSLEKIGSLLQPNQAPQPLLAGAARIDITPPVGTPLAGYGNRKGRGSIGIHDRVYTRALALSDGNQAVIILANDLLAITDDIHKAVHKKISREISLRPDNLMISATHTHSGPGALAKRFWEGFAAGPYDPDLFEVTTDKMAEAALIAYREMRPARLGGASIPVPDLIRNRMVKDGPTDPDLAFLIIQTLDRLSTFYLVNYSAHPTVLKDSNDLISGDFPGALESELEQGVGAIALYTAGAVADQTANPPPGMDDFERMQKMGGILAERVRGASALSKPQDRIRIGAIIAPIYLPPTQVRVGTGRRLASPLGNLFFDRETTIQAILLGDYVLLGVPGDLGSEIGLEIKSKAEAQGLKAIIVGFANDYIGYIIPSKYYFTGAYEARMSFNGPYMDRYLKEVSFKLIESLAVYRQVRGDR